MTGAAVRRRLADGRWHYQHGPIDLLIEAHGDAGAVERAHAASWQDFTGVLSELVRELAVIRQPIRPECLDGTRRFGSSGEGSSTGSPTGPVARRMWQACLPHCSGFITPMAAVAGSVADELIGHYDAPGIDRAWINNGGDIALHLAAGVSVRIAVCVDISKVRSSPPPLGEVIKIAADDPVRGLATSGWRGRSFSLGIADSVTVLAGSAAAADAAATVIANAVDLVHPGIVRVAARVLRDDSDLGELPVTVEVPPLNAEETAKALEAGLARAENLQSRGLIDAAALYLQGQRRITPAAATRIGRLPEGGVESLDSRILSRSRAGFPAASSGVRA